MISEVSKRKLKAFHFVEESLVESKSHTENKENLPELSCDGDASKAIDLGNASQPLSKNAVPSTPINPGRLPLKHLLGSISSKPNAIVAPHQLEDLSWKQSTPPQKTPGRTPRQSKKRARSSSPPGTAESDKQKFTTPKQDPAAEVWSRFRGDARVNGSVLRASQEGIESLLVDSSPHSSATAGSVGGLRRYNSCGHQWPASRKRRKVSHVGGSIGHTEVEALPPSPPFRPKLSKISQLLLEAERLRARPSKVQSTLECTTSDANELEDDHMDVHQPEPVPESITEQHVDQESPLQNRHQPNGSAQASAQSNVVYDPDIGLHETQAPAHIQVVEPSDHDFSDMDEYEDEDLDNLLATAPESLLINTNSISQPVPEVTKFDVNNTQDSLDAGWENIDEALMEADLLNTSARLLAQDKLKSPTPQSLETQVLSSDDFDDDDFTWDDFAAAEAAATQQSKNKTSSEPRNNTIQRYVIKSVHETRYIDQHGRDQPQKIVQVEEDRSSVTKTVILRQAWFETQCSKDAFVHVFGEFDSNGSCTIDDDNNIFILHPDHLVSATVVADSFGCLRRAVLQDRVKATGTASEPMLYGNILHELFQEAMKRNKWDMETLSCMLLIILPKHLETLAELNVSLSHVQDHLKAKMIEMSAWAGKFVRDLPAADAIVDARHGTKNRMSINKLLDVEEHVWSPNYGLKGNIDATVQITIEDNSGQPRTLTVPLEVKTGKRISEAHQAQTALYTLLISDRYDIKTTDGVLYYLESSKTIRIQAVRRELTHMIMKRNELACYIRERRRLPPMLEPNRQRLCNGCYAQTSCYLYHKLSENGDGSLVDKRQIYNELVAPLKSVHGDFFQKWDYLITKEESEMMKFKRELWTMLSHQREKLNRCFGGVIIQPDSCPEESSAISKINRYQYTFIKQHPTPQFSFTESQITTGEPIVISDEQGHFALANGYVTGVHRNQISVAVDRRLHNARRRQTGFCSQNNQVFNGIMELNPHQSPVNSQVDPVVYRIDKDEFSNGMATVRNNLLQIMDTSVYKATNLRALIAEDRKPIFKQRSSAWNPSTQWGAQMNEDQKAAIDKVMAAEDYALVLGMPGTGKTTTIAQIIRSLVTKGKTVLLTSYTHTAVDNILLKLRGSNIDILRLGVLAKVHPEVKEFARLAAEPRESVEEIFDSWHKPSVVATTCLGINHSLFTQRIFDYCIVDEASQITLPVCLGPIRMAKSFILVGDHYQLPPLVQNKEALEGGLDMSLFRLLSERQPEAVVSLEHQYRMCENIMSIANRLIYSGRLKCGNSDVANRTLVLPRSQAALHSHHSSTSIQSPTSSPSIYICPSTSYSSCWLMPILEPAHQVIFLNTDAIGFSEVNHGNRTTNPVEAAIVSQAVTLLVDAGMPANDLGVVTFYRSQLALLHQSIRGHPALELHTADKFQGRDKEAVIVSFVRSNTDGHVGELLQDWRRINVAVTRARSKLIIVGSVKTLEAGPEVLRGLVALCKERDWVVDLPQSAVEMHAWPELSTKATQAAMASHIETPSMKRLHDGPVSQSDQQTKKLRRNPLAEITPNRKLAVQKGSVLRVPGKIASVNQRLLGSKPIMRDILNDLLPGGLVNNAE